MPAHIDNISIAPIINNSKEYIVLDVLNTIMTLDPPGIGARNLRECLLAQVADISDTLTYQVLDEYFNDFAFVYFWYTEWAVMSKIYSSIDGGINIVKICP